MRFKSQRASEDAVALLENGVDGGQVRGQHLLHCLVGIGNNLINRFCDIVNEYVENLSAEEMKHARALTNYRLIMVETAKKRDEFDASPEGKSERR